MGDDNVFGIQMVERIWCHLDVEYLAVRVPHVDVGGTAPQVVHEGSAWSNRSASIISRKHTCESLLTVS